jgi:hypothetical protein
MPEPKGPSKIWVRQVDDAVVQDATYDFGRNDRQYLDSQIRGSEQHLTASLVNGIVASWFPGDPALVGGSQPGDVVCVSAATPGTVTTATFGALATAGEPMGIVLEAAPQGAPIHTALSGEIPPAITGLPGGGNLLYAVVGSNGRVTTKASIATNDYVLGTCTANGFLTLRVQLPAVVTGTTTNVSGSGFWHESSNALDPAASKGTAGQFAITKAGGGDTGWASISGDATASATTPRQLTVTGLQNVPIAATAPTSGQVLGFNGTQYVPTNPTSGGGSSVGNVANWSVTPLFWDPGNSTGLASDDFTNPLRGKDSAHPILTWNTGLCQGFWGTYSPVISSGLNLGNIVINQMSSQPDATDNVRLSPYGRGSVKIVGALGAAQTVGTGTLSGLLAKNASTRTLLAANLTPSAGTVAVGMRVTNTTRNSSTHVLELVSGNLWRLDQPYTNAGAEDDGWTTGDSVSFQNEVTTSLASADAKDGANCPITFQDITTRSGTTSVLGNSVLFTGCVLLGNVTTLPNNVSVSIIRNCSIGQPGSQFIANSLSNLPAASFVGGSNHTSLMVGSFYCGGDFVNAGGMSQLSGLNTNVWVTGNNSNNQWNVGAPVQFKGYISGIGQINVEQNGYVDGLAGQGQVQYVGTAASVFLLQHNSGNPLCVNNNQFADAEDRTVDPSAKHTNRALTPAALDLSVAAGGFAGIAYGPSGMSAYEQVGQPTTAPAAYITPVANGGTGIGTAGTNGQVLTIVSGVPAWAAPTGGGGSSFYQTIQDLNGAALPQQPIFQFAGGGQSVANAGGKTVITIPLPFYQTVQDPSNNPLGQQPVLQFTGAGVSVANGSGKTVVTIPGGGSGGSFTAGGDLTGNNVAQQVQSVSGASGAGGTVPLNISKFQWAKGQLSPTIEQATADATVAPQSSFWRPQAANGAAAAGNGTPGSAVVDLGLPRANGTEARLTVSRGGLFGAAIGALPSNPNFFGVYLADSTNQVITSDGANTLRIGSGPTQGFLVATPTSVACLAWKAGEVQVFSSNAGFFANRTDPTGLNGVISIGEVNTAPAVGAGPASGSGVELWAQVGHVVVAGADLAGNKSTYLLSPIYQNTYGSFTASNLPVSPTWVIVAAIDFDPTASTKVRIRVVAQAQNGTGTNAVVAISMTRGSGVTNPIDTGSVMQTTVLPSSFSDLALIYDWNFEMGVTFPLGTTQRFNICGLASQAGQNIQGKFEIYEVPL